MRKRYFLLSIFTMMLCLWIFTPTAHADSNSTYKVDSDNLNVRTAPSHDAEVIGHLNKGNQVTVFKEKYGWLQTYFDGKIGWVASQHLYQVDDVDTTESKSTSTSQEESNNNAAGKIKITEDAVHIRSGQDTNQKILDIAYKGDSYTLLDTQGDWHKIQLGNGTAWVASWLTDQPTTSKQSSNSNNSSSSNESSESTQAPPNEDNNESSSNGQSSLDGYNIMLDASHGGKDPGAIGISGTQEKDVALDVTNAVAEEMRNQGANVILTRTSDSFISLKDRVRISDAYGTHAFISLHFNAFTSSDSNGISTHYYSNGSEQQLAQNIQSALSKHTNLQDRGVRQDNYYVLRESKADSILVELGFITNQSDLDKIQSGNYPAEVADAIAEGLNNHFN